MIRKRIKTVRLSLNVPPTGGGGNLKDDLGYTVPPHLPHMDYVFFEKVAKKVLKLANYAPREVKFFFFRKKSNSCETGRWRRYARACG